MYSYLDTLEVEPSEMIRIHEYLELIKRRSNGEKTVYLTLKAYSLTGSLRLGSLITPATWIRNFVRSHPAYKLDSVVSQDINYDLFVAFDEM